MRIERCLPILLLVYGASSLLHFAHNAEFLADYPNLPASLSRMNVYGAWLGITAIGALGWLLVRLGYRLAGLTVIAVYATFGFDGLGHYTLAPVAAHTSMMNATIWLEVFAAGLLLVATAHLALKRIRARA